MKKKLLIISIFILLLIPNSIKAYSYKSISITKDSLISKGFISQWPNKTEVPNLYVSNDAYSANNDNFIFSSVINGSNHYIGHISTVGKAIGSNNYEMDKIETFKSLENKNNNLTDTQRQLLEDLIINGYHYDLTDTQTVDGIINSKDTTLNMMAMQILIWEVVEGGRTSFATVAPDAITSDIAKNNSYYSRLVYPNGGEGNSSGTLYFYYRKIVDDVNAVVNSDSSTAFNTESYSLSWDGTNKKYLANVSGLGKYTSCESSDSKVAVTTNGTTAYISSNSEIDAATITCKYAVGGTTNSNVYYFKFKETGNCSTIGSCANIVYGGGKKIYSKSFIVTTRTADLKIKNINMNKNTINGSTFKFTHRTTTNYTFNVKANDSNKTNVNKSGEYIVSQISVPSGYEQISDFNLRIDTTDNSVKDCTNSSKDSNGNLTCMNGRVTVTKEDNSIMLTIISLEKNFKIVKVNENNDIVRGTTFQILNSSNKPVKFKLNDGLFVYDTSGTITDIYMQNSDAYAISMLPKGDYSLVETKAASPYRLSSKADQNTTKIRVDDNGDLLVLDESQNKYITAVNSSIQIKNYRTLVKIASSKNGSPIKDASYSLYAENKTTLIKSKKDQDGIYNYSEDQNTAEAVTEYLTDANGFIYVYDLPVGKYYFKNNDDPNSSFIEVRIDVTKRGATVNESRVINTISLSATKNSFSFYKTDEQGVYLSGGKFKLQRYDSTRARYVDLKLIKVENDGTYNEKSDIFREYDEVKDKNMSADEVKKIPRQFTLTNGIATFIDMKPGSEYRIVENQAPSGYELQTVNDTATVTIDDSGNAYGLLVLINKKVSAQTGQAQAELIINIDTGQNRIRYAIIIGSIIVILGALFLLQKKKK